jgi:hypothetical protein
MTRQCLSCGHKSGTANSADRRNLHASRAQASLALALSIALASPSIAQADTPTPTATPDFSDYPCPIPSYVGISLLRIAHLPEGDYALTFSMPRDATNYFAGYTFAISDDSQTKLATVRGSDATVQKDKNGLAIRTFTFRTPQPITTPIVAIETYPNASCKFTNIEVGRASIESDR